MRPGAAPRPIRVFYDLDTPVTLATLDRGELPEWLSERGLEPFDLVLSWFTSFGYFDDDDNRLVLRQFADILRPGGALIIETMHHDGFVRGFTSAPAATLTERGEDSMTDVTTFDPVSGRVETARTVRRGGQVRRSHHSVRLPTVPEFDEWLRVAGFSARTYSERGGGALRFDSWRVGVVATTPVSRR